VTTTERDRGAAEERERIIALIRDHYIEDAEIVRVLVRLVKEINGET